MRDSWKSKVPIKKQNWVNSICRDEFEQQNPTIADEDEVIQNAKLPLLVNKCFFENRKKKIVVL